MSLTPNKILELFEINKINRLAAYEQLICFLENSSSDTIRKDAIDILDIIGIYNDKLFAILENIIISDSNIQIRNIAIKFINKRFITKALTPLRWAIKHESNYSCLISIIKTLEEVNNHEAKSILFNEVKKIIKIKYISNQKRIENKRYRKVIKKILKLREFESFSNKELSEIFINFLTIRELVKRYPNAYYELDPQNGLVKELDLSDFLEFEVKGTPWGWKNDIKSLSEVIGLKYLQNLTKIDLSNNQIKSLRHLVNLKNLTHLILTNNRISELKNLEYIKKLPNLEYLDLRYNDIAKNINPNDFNQNIRVLLNEFLILK